jgi:replicative DNA helicase
VARTTISGDSENPTSASGRVLPHDLEVEKAVLSALLLDNQAIHTVLTEVKPEDFYHPAHQQLYRAMLVLQDENEPVDLHTLSDYLNTRKLLDALGGPVFLAEIADYEATAANVVQHARILRDKSIKRSLIAVATEIAEAGFEQADRADRDRSGEGPRQLPPPARRGGRRAQLRRGADGARRRAHRRADGLQGLRREDRGPSAG